MGKDIYYDKYLKYKYKYNALKNMFENSLYGGGTGACADCRSAKNTEVSNTAIVLYTTEKEHGKVHIFMVADNGTVFMTPGGEVDVVNKKKYACWETMAREYLEEVGFPITQIVPKGSVVQSLDYHHKSHGTCTRIYYYNVGRRYIDLMYTTKPANGTGGHGYGETSGYAWIDVNKIFDSSVNVKHYVKASINLMYSKGLLK